MSIWDTTALRLEAEAILDRAERERRDLTADEDQKLTELISRSRDGSRSRGTQVGGRDGVEGQPTGPYDPRQPRGERWETADGRQVRALTPRERLSDLEPARGDQLSLGKYVKGLISGNWKGAEREQRAMSEGTLSAGGYAVPTPLSLNIIDKARNQAVCFRAGAVTVPMDSQTLKIARLTTDPTIAWKTENAAATASDAAFDQVTFTAQTLVGLVKLSVELVEDSINADSLIETTLARILALELDRACLRGSGTPPEPKGIRNQTGVGVDTTTFGTNGSAISGTTPAGAVAWDWLSKAVYTVRGLNEYPNAAIYSERTAGELDLLRTSTGAPLPPPISVAGDADAAEQLPGAAFQPGRGIQLLSTNAVINTVTQGSSNVASTAYVGDFTKLMVGMRTQLVLEVSRTAADSTSSAFANLQVFLRAYLRADVQLARPAAFRVVEGIL